MLAVPVGSPGTLQDLPEADAVVAVEQPPDFRAVGFHYEDFSPTERRQVVVLLDRAARRVFADDRLAARIDCDVDVELTVDGVALEGHLHLPDPSAAVVVFAHGSGSSRHSPRNRLVADVLYDAGIGTFLLDLLSPSEENDRRFVFDVLLLASGLAAATTWVRGTAGGPGGTGRLLRCQHRCGRRTPGRGRPARRGVGGGVAGWQGEGFIGAYLACEPRRQTQPRPSRVLPKRMSSPEGSDQSHPLDGLHRAAIPDVVYDP